jgi:putative SOS response-associated peptidase YedK
MCRATHLGLAEGLPSLLRPLPAGLMAAYPVSPLVNSPKNDDPRCMEPEPANLLSGVRQ